MVSMVKKLVSRLRALVRDPLRRQDHSGADQGLDDASGRFELVLAGADAAIWDWDVIRRKVAYSPRWKALRGFAEDEVSDAEEEWSEGIHPDDAPRVMAAVQAHFEGRTLVFAEAYRVRRKDGSWMWVADRGLAQRDATGRVVRMAGAETDITERKQAEELARQRLAELEDLYRNAPVGLCVLDRELRFVRINDRLAEINGIPAADHPGKTVRELMPELADTVEPEMRRVLETGRPRLDIEIVSETPAQPDFQRSWLEQWLPITDDQGGVTGLSIVVEETTARKRSEDALRESEERLRLALDAAYLVSFEWDIQRNEVRRFVSSEPALAATAGGKPGTFEDVREVVHPEDRELFTANVQAAMARHDGQYESEFRVVRPDGSVAWLHERGRVERDAQGSPLRLVGLSQDISERKRNEEALNAHRQLLETVVNQIPAAVCLIRGSDLRLQLVNPAYQMIAPGKEMLGRTLDELWPETGQDFAAICRRVLKTGEPHQVADELNMIRRQPDGPLEPAHFSWSMQRVYLPGDEGLGLILSAWETTARRQAEEALRASEARLRLAQASAGAGMWDWDVSNGKLEWSAELFRLFGLDPGAAEPSFEVWSRVVHADDRLLAEQRIETALANHTALASEYRIILPSGAVRWINALGQASYDPSGAPLRMSGICIDITDRKQAEEDLRRSEERYRTLFESMAEGFALHEMIFDDRGRPSDYRFLEVNPAFATLTGLDAEAIIGRTVRQVIPTVEESWIETYGRVVQTGQSERFERNLAALGRWYDVFVFSPAPGRFATAFTDITARKHAEEDLRQIREDLDRAQEVGQIGWWRLDVRRDVLTWSDESHRIFGVPVGTPMSYQTFLETIHPDDREYVDERWSAGLRGEPYDVEHRIVANGRVKWVREKAYLEFDPQGALLGGFGITQDITERKWAEQQLRESLAEKELLLREIHHRVKNNLQVVSSLVSLQADELADPQLREVFGELRNRVRSMALIHEKLYESGGLAKLNFADYVASLMQSVWSAHGVVGAGVKLHLEVEPVAVSVATAVPCGLILNELASNALKHAFPSDGGEVTVGLSREPATGRLRLWVRDNGVGLPADLDWRHAHSLGLRLVKMLARQLEGTVETRPGPGTEFLICFVATEVEKVPGLSEAASSTTRGDRA
jgi:PAS domain S-box-containing protein